MIYCHSVQTRLCPSVVNLHSMLINAHLQCVVHNEHLPQNCKRDSPRSHAMLCNYRTNKVISVHQLNILPYVTKYSMIRRYNQVNISLEFHCTNILNKSNIHKFCFLFLNSKRMICTIQTTVYMCPSHDVQQCYVTPQLGLHATGTQDCRVYKVTQHFLSISCNNI